MTTLSPLEEILHKHWATANGIAEPDHPDNLFDFRGLYKASGGRIHPAGVVSGMASAHNQAMGASTPEGDAQAKQAELQKKLMGDKLKEHFKGADADAEIQKAHNNLHHLMLKRHLGI